MLTLHLPKSVIKQIQINNISTVSEMHTGLAFTMCSLKTGNVSERDLFI